MDSSESAVIEANTSRPALSAVKRQYRCAELKRQIVEETLLPGPSVARVAWAHGVNANQVFAWRRQYQRGLLGHGKGSAPGLLAVRVAGAAEGTQGAPGTIQVELPQGQLRVTGRVDPEALRLVLGALLGCWDWRRGRRSGLWPG
jgi:transposase